MKSICIALLGLILGSSLVYAEEAIVIDSKMLSEMPSAPAIETRSPAPEPNAQPGVGSGVPLPEQVGGEQLLQGHKISARQRRELAKAEIANRNKQAGDDYLALNKVKQGVVTLPSGVQYRIIKQGKGKKAREEDVIMCRFTGTLIDGSVVATSASNKPVPVGVSTLIPGLKEAVKLMPAGSKWQIVIPPDQAYGEAGNRGVGPNAVLVYNMDISSIK